MDNLIFDPNKQTTNYLLNQIYIKDSYSLNERVFNKLNVFSFSDTKNFLLYEIIKDKVESVQPIFLQSDDGINFNGLFGENDEVTGKVIYMNLHTCITGGTGQVIPIVNLLLIPVTPYSYDDFGFYGNSYIFSERLSLSNPPFLGRKSINEQLVGFFNQGWITDGSVASNAAGSYIFALKITLK